MVKKKISLLEAYLYILKYSIVLSELSINPPRSFSIYWTRTFQEGLRSFFLLSIMRFHA